MEPKLPAPSLGPEQSPVYYGQGPERASGDRAPEAAIERKAERFEQQRATAAVSPVSVALPMVPQPVVSPTVVAPLTSDAPLVANDDDLIEKEWVLKAKKIIAETKDDPYRREQEVGRLQADYLRKRYGKELGTPQ